jgi:hypothetical protein
LLGRSFGGENLNNDFSQISHRFRATTFYVEVAFIIVIADLKIETIRFNIVSQQGSLFEIKEKQKEGKKIMPFVAFFNRHFRVLLFE